jgi:Ser/Thr protein kinase RdoA (MazF antagonist)
MGDEIWWEGLCERAGIGELRGHSFLARGAGNEVHRVETGQGVFVLKVAKPEHGSRLGFEHAFLAKSEGNFGPGVRHFDGSGVHHGQELLVEEFLVGAHPFHLGVPEAAALGEALRVLHSADTAPFATFLDKPSWKGYLASRVVPQLERSREFSPSSVHGEIEAMVAGAGERGRFLTPRLEMRQRGLVHTDVIPLNVVSTKDRGMVLIDWEWVRIDLPEWDLGSVLKAFTMEEGALDSFWAAYALGHDPDILEFVGILHHLNVVAWRLCAFYEQGGYREVADTFLADLEVELDWLRTHLG